MFLLARGKEKLLTRDNENALNPWIALLRERKGPMVPYSPIALFTIALVLSGLLASQIFSAPTLAQSSSSNMFSIIAATGQSSGNFYPVVFRLNNVTGAVSVCTPDGCNLLRDVSVR